MAHRAGVRRPQRLPELKLAADAIYEEVLSRTAPVVAQRMYAEAWRKTA